MEISRKFHSSSMEKTKQRPLITVRLPGGLSHPHIVQTQRPILSVCGKGSKRQTCHSTGTTKRCKYDVIICWTRTSAISLSDYCSFTVAAQRQHDTKKHMPWCHIDARRFSCHRHETNHFNWTHNNPSFGDSYQNTFKRPWWILNETARRSGSTCDLAGKVITKSRARRWRQLARHHTGAEMPRQAKHRKLFTIRVIFKSYLNNIYGGLMATLGKCC